MAELGIPGMNQPQRPQKDTDRITQSDWVVSVIGFFLAMAIPYKGMAPFGLSFLAQERKLSVRSFIYLGIISCGSIVVCERPDVTKYITAGLLYLAVLFVLERDVVPDELTAGVAAGICVFLTGLVSVYWTGFTVKALLTLICEAGAVTAGAVVISKSNGIIRGGPIIPEKLSSDEKISLGAIVALTVLSLRSFYFGTFFSVMHMGATVVILTVAAGCGAAFSTVAGVILGAVCGIDSDFFMPILGAFSFCGFLAGVFSKYGKSGTVVGMIIANAVLIVYTNGAMRAMLSLYEVMAASVLFVLLPSGYINNVKRIVCIDTGEREAIGKMKENIRIKLGAVAASFETMSRTLLRLADRREECNDGDIATVFDLAADRICKNCRKSSLCWTKDFDFTYEALSKIMNVMEEKGVVTVSDTDERFREKCLHLPKLIAELNHQLDMHRERCLWQERMKESRELVGEQLSDVSAVIERLSDEIGECSTIDSFSAKDIRDSFEKRGIKIKDISVVQETGGRQKVIMTFRSVFWSDKPKAEIMKLMKRIFKADINVRDFLFDDGRYIKAEFSIAEKYKIETDCACRAVSEKNGDNYRFSHIGSGKYVVALSDGMGTGCRASRESEAILELLDSFLRAGFDSRMAVKFINSVMLLKSNDEAFVTIDVCIIDLYTGTAEFIKTGAEPSFILRESSVDTVKAASLPVGVIADMEAETASRKMRDGDVIVMVTDGVETKTEGSLLWVGEFMDKNCREDQDENMAEKILNLAIEKNNGEINDDMTVLSVRLKEVS